MDTFGVLYYRGSEHVNKEEIAELDNIELDLYDQPKTQSQRLRNVMYKVYLEQGGRETSKNTTKQKPRKSFNTTRTN